MVFAMILDISELSERNPWWTNLDRIWNDGYIRRALESGITWRPRIFTIDELNRDAVYTLRGPRQVGKTTYLKFLIAELLKEIDDSRRIIYLSCDPLENVSELRETLLNYLRWVRGFTKDRLYIVLDEVTRVTDWQLAVKDLLDHNYLGNSVVIACGSHSLDVRKGAELLPGRRGNYVPPPDRILYPMSFREFVSAYEPDLFTKIESRIKGKSFLEAIKELRVFRIDLEILFNKYLITGGFPAAISNFKKNAERTISIHPYNDLKYYIRGDIIRAKKNPDLAEKIINITINMMGDPVSINKIAREANCDPKTAQEYVYVLESMYIILRIPYPDINSWTPLERKMKKLYLFDPFLLYTGRHMLFEGEDPYELTFKTLNTMKPKILELATASHLKRITPRLFYWRTTKGREIDFLVTSKNSIIGIEVKETPKYRDTTYALAVLNRIPSRRRKTAIVTGLTRETIINNHQKIIPIPHLLYIINKLFV